MSRSTICSIASFLTAWAVSSLLPSSVTAAGFQLREGSADWVANSFAGTAAKAYDAGTAWTNPAGMTFVNMGPVTPGEEIRQTTEIDSALTLYLPSVGFKGENVIGSTRTVGSGGGNAGPPQWTGGLEAIWRYSPELTFGIATEVPFGLSTVYPGNFVGRYQALVSSIADYEVFLSAAYKLTDHFSIGAGPVIDYYHIRLTSAINTGSAALLTGDPVADLRGDAVSAGYHLGAMYRSDYGFRAGIDYRSRIGIAVAGKQTIYIPPLLRASSPTAAALLSAANSDVTTQTTIPDVLTLSAFYDITDEWAAMATLQWTHWSLLQQASIITTKGSTQRLDLRFHSTWFGSVGVNYRPRWASNLMLQSGFGYDQSAVSNSTRSPRLPDSGRILLSVGFTYDIVKNMLSVQGAYLHAFSVGNNHSDFSSGSGAGVLVGKYSSSVDVLTLGTKLRF